MIYAIYIYFYFDFDLFRLPNQFFSLQHNFGSLPDPQNIYIFIFKIHKIKER